MKPVADKIRASAHKIMSLWEERANNEVRPANVLSSLVLRNALPDVIGELANAIETKKAWTPLGVRQEVTRCETAEAHGKQRADTEAYNLAEVIIEFQLLRQVIFEVLEEDAPLSKVDRDLIINSFERTTNDSACMFAALHLKNREQFTLTLVHDFRSPLSVIKMATHLARKQASNNPSLQYALDKIDKNTKQLESMIGELLDVSRITAGKGFAVNAQEMRLDELVKKTVSHLTDAYGDRFEARANDAITGCWDSEGLRRIIENLAINALKYGDGTSPIVIHAEKSENHVKLTVHNEGNVISLEDQQKIFEKFSKASSAESATGWGLGLALVKGMAEAHKGTVRVESSLETGTNFIVELPTMYSATEKHCVEKELKPVS